MGKLLCFPFFFNGDFATMPKTLGGVIAWLVSTVIVVVVGNFIINRISFLKQISGNS